MYDRPTYKMEGKNWYIYFSTDVKNGEWRIGTKENMTSRGKYYSWYLDGEIHPLHPDGNSWKRPNRTNKEKQLQVERIGQFYVETDICKTDCTAPKLKNISTKVKYLSTKVKFL